MVIKKFIAIMKSGFCPLSPRHPLGVCLVQFSEGIRVPLSAPFYQPCYLHREHNVSIH